MDSEEAVKKVREYAGSMNPLGSMAFINEVKPTSFGWQIIFTTPEPENRGFTWKTKKIIINKDTGMIDKVEDVLE